jgi:putative phosphoribosyl transferase
VEATVYADRAAAGRALADALRRELPRAELDGALVLALPRGGVPVARVVADEFGAELDVLLVRKIGLPGHRELGVGALGEDGVEVVDRRRVRRSGADPVAVEAVAAEERRELERRAHHYRGARPRSDVRGRTVVVVDDGVATGVSAEAALEVVRRGGPARLVLAVPVGAPASLARLEQAADLVCCPSRPRYFRAVGEWYDDFRQVSDEEVVAALDR